MNHAVIAVVDSPLHLSSPPQNATCCCYVAIYLVCFCMGMIIIHQHLCTRAGWYRACVAPDQPGNCPHALGYRRGLSASSELCCIRSTHCICSAIFSLLRCQERPAGVAANTAVMCLRHFATPQGSRHTYLALHRSATWGARAKHQCSS